MKKKGKILLVDNHTGKLSKFFNYLIFRSYPVELVNTAAQAIDFVRNNAVDLIISQVMLIDSDITELEERLNKLRFTVPIIAIMDDPLAEKALKALKRKYRYIIRDLNKLNENEKLISLLCYDNPEEPIENNPSVKWNEKYTIIIPSLAQYIERVISYILKKISSYRPASQQINAIRMSLSEAIANAIEHGNHFNFDKTVEISFMVNPTHITIHIKDEGEGFDYKSNSQSIRELNKQYKMRGRGLYIIHKFMDEVEFVSPGNKIIMTKYFSNHRF